MKIITRLPLTAAAIAIAARTGSAQRLTPPDTSQNCRWSVECSAPGVSLRMVESRRTGEGNKTRVDVSPRVAGFPAGVPLTLWMRRVEAKPSWVVTGYAFDSAGKLGCADRAANAALAATAADAWCPVPLDTLRLTVGEAMAGEPFAFAISTPDGRETAYATVVPRPVAATVAGCGSLDAQLITADARAVRILGTGFAPSSQLTTESVRGRDRVAGQVTTDSTGRFIGIVTSNGKGGDASYTVRAPTCAVTLPYAWGRSAW